MSLAAQSKEEQWEPWRLSRLALPALEQEHQSLHHQNHKMNASWQEKTLVSNKMLTAANGKHCRKAVTDFDLVSGLCGKVKCFLPNEGTKISSGLGFSCFLFLTGTIKSSATIVPYKLLNTFPQFSTFSQLRSPWLCALLSTKPFLQQWNFTKSLVGAALGKLLFAGASSHSSFPALHSPFSCSPSHTGCPPSCAISQSLWFPQWLLLYWHQFSQHCRLEGSHIFSYCAKLLWI